MTEPYQIALLVLVGFIAGAINAVAGGGKLLVLPVLLWNGLSPLTANITASLVLGPGAAGATWQYRSELRRIPSRVYWLLVPCFAGALVGIVLLQHTSSSAFAKIVPWLTLIGVGFFAFQPALVRYIRQPLTKWPHLSLAVIGLLLLIASVYGGYFGAGFGFVLMGLLGFSTLSSIYQLSAIKNIAGGGMEVMTTIYFAIAGGIHWSTGLWAMAGCIAGGILGARVALKLPQRAVRLTIIGVGLAFTAVVFVKGYLN